MELKSGRYVSKIWYVEAHISLQFNWLAHLWKNDEGNWQLDYRFRYYRDDNLGPDSEDKKTFWVARFPPGMSEDAARAAGDGLAEKLAQECGGNIDVIDTKTDDPETIISMMEKKSWCHRSVVEVN